MRKVVRPYDVVGRWGGEEFLCLLPETDIHSAATIAERMRSRIQEKVFVWEETGISVKVTVGVSMIKEADTIDEVITRADKALYQGKHSGKNTVTIID
jgi:diguanylate cyclase (GGDEF)-like protein